MTYNVDPKKILKILGGKLKEPLNMICTLVKKTNPIELLTRTEKCHAEGRYSCSVELRAYKTEEANQQEQYNLKNNKVLERFSKIDSGALYLKSAHNNPQCILSYLYNDMIRIQHNNTQNSSLLCLLT